MKPLRTDDFMPKNFTFDSCKKAHPTPQNENERICLFIPGLAVKPPEF